MLSSFRQNLLGCVRNSTRARKTSRETSTGTPRDTCTRGAVDHQILDVSYNIYKLKHPFGCFCFWKEWFPKPEQRRIFRTLKETSTGSPRDTCTRGAVDYRFLSVLTKTFKHPKWVLFLCCFPHSGNLRAANPEFPFHGFWKAWFPKTEQRCGKVVEKSVLDKTREIRV